MAKSTLVAQPDRWMSANDTLTSGITKSNAALPISTILEQQSADGFEYRTIIRVNGLVKAIAADAALGFGEKIATFPQGLIRPVGGYVVASLSTPTGLSSTAGEISLGSAIATGAIATMGAGSNAMEDLMEGTTISSLVAATPQTGIIKANTAARGGTTATHGVDILDGSGTAKSVYLNLCSTWDQTAAESVTFSAYVVLDWAFVGTGLES